MNSQMSRCNINRWAWLAVVLLVVTTIFAPCTYEAALAGEKGRPPGGPPADPAIAFIQTGRPSKLMVMNDDGSNVTAIYNTQSSLGAGPSWSPDGQNIAFIKDFALWRIDVTVVGGVPQGSNAIELLPRIPGDVQSFSTPAWSPLGDEILMVQIQEPDGLWLVPSDGGTPTVLYEAPPGYTVYYPAWSPDASQVAFVEFIQGDFMTHWICILDIASREVTTVAEVSSLPKFLDWARTLDALVFDMDWEIYVLDIATGQAELVWDNGMFPTWSSDDARVAFRDLSGNKLSVLDLATGAITRFKISGYWPDWRR